MRLEIKIFLTLLLLAVIVFVVLKIPKTSNESEPLEISGLVVPHHNIVASQRAQVFDDLSNRLGPENYPETVILVSPNHYLSGEGKVQTSKQDWNLSQGQIYSNKEVISKLVERKQATLEPYSFADEHGIYAVLADIHRTFPKANLVPLMLKDVSGPELQNLVKTFEETCSKCLVIASVDFSHYQPAQLAELHDQKSIRELQTLNTQNLLKAVEVDSGSSLALLALWAKSRQTLQFELRNHTNSNLLLNSLDAEGTSHVFGWYQTGTPIEPEEFVSFVITPKSEFGVENRTIWGTDFVYDNLSLDLPNSVNTIIAGKITKQGIEYFALPIDSKNPNKLLIGSSKSEELKKLYESSKNNLISSLAGDYIKINTNIHVDFKNLSQESLRDILKSLIK